MAPGENLTVMRKRDSGYSLIGIGNQHSGMDIRSNGVFA
jgi:hypothetical protein